MIDIHAHILPGLDDGSSSLEISLRMAQIAREQGIRTIIATPHHRNGLYNNESDAIDTAVEALNTELQRKGIDVVVHGGQEIRLYEHLLQDLIDGNGLQSLHRSRYLLIELPTRYVPEYCRELIYELRLLHKVPIIAHPERNLEIMNDTRKLFELVREGALCQITSRSLLGGFGSNTKKTAWKLCKQQMVHFIASDCHNCHSRAPDLVYAYRQINNVLGENCAQYFMDNANNVLMDEDIVSQESILAAKKWYQFWR